MTRTQGGPGEPWGDFAEQAMRLGKAVAGMAAHTERRMHGRAHGMRGPFPPNFGPFGAAFGGPGPWGRGGPWGGRGPKAKRGDVRAAILSLLAEEPRNGYQIIQEINERSHGAWKPSPGAVYPALQQLADEGLIRGEEGDGRRTFHLTDAGRAYVDEHPEEVTAPWEAMTAEVDGDVVDLFKEAAQMGTALMQVVHAGSRGQVAEARRVVAETRRRLYGILAEDQAEGDDLDGRA
ncbi:PadR family transcriptional regulator [Actinomadura alba]|uniref:PadR family transcriptional regulator n=1 Tax=Actinomadura alba TaxID=406431 RepID=A0ABR7LZT4_9ACTN|nr:PadR family transcriptional regulator [Actinomadura alba]MBC6469990.1 PadR family transcriptional regulator [Actinomadura alba]